MQTMSNFLYNVMLILNTEDGGGFETIIMVMIVSPEVGPRQSGP